MKKLNNEYSDLMQQAQQAVGRKEAVGLIHKAAKLKTKFDNYEMMQSEDSMLDRDTKNINLEIS